MKKERTVASLVYAFMLTVIANSWIFLNKWIVCIYVPIFLGMIVFAGTLCFKTDRFRLRICHHGAIMLTALMLAVPLSVSIHIVLAFKTIPAQYMQFIFSVIYCFCLQAIWFWVGILCIYFSSFQLGIKERIIGIVFGMIPGLNLFILYRILRIVFSEVDYEQQKQLVNAQRKDQQICKTKYPIVLVHGICLRDYKYFNYWGRIPKELQQNGAQIFYGDQHSAASIKDCAQEVADRVKELCKTLPCEKVNIIAHSKGGLDTRYAVEKLGLAPYVASITTVSTPHRGCLYAENLLHNVDEHVQQRVARTYNRSMRLLGDKKPDFLAAVRDLTNDACEKFNQEIKDPEGIYCQSFGSVLVKASGAKFPMNLTYPIVKCFDGRNDGLVSETSFSWGEKYTLLEPTGKEGISHGDMIDLNRMNIEGFDVREFYVELVQDLKNKGF